MLDGWLELTPDVLEERRQALTSEDCKRFFDGQEPEWRHALAPPDQIPRRPVAVDGLAKLRATPDEGPAIVLLVGADGSGKSTALKQIASDLVADGRRVLVRSEGAALDPTAVAELPVASHGWVLVSDDANEIAQDVEKALEQQLAAGRRDIGWLLSARDVDWKSQFVRNGRVLEPAWESLGQIWPLLGNRATAMAVKAEATEASAGLAAWAAAGAHAADAPDILAAWAAADALGALAGRPESERAEALEEHSNKKLGVSNATLLGGSLDLRYGAERLAAFVQEAVGRLDGAPELQEAFLFLAAAQVAGVDGLDLFVLADLVGIDRDRRRSALGGRLAEAGLASGSTGALRSRHPAIAQAAVQLLAAGRLAGDLEDLYRRLIRGTATTGNDVKTLAAGGAIMNCGPLLSEKLQQAGVGKEQSDRIACTVADEAELALPDYLLFTVGRARTQQAANRPGEARRTLRARFADATSKNDWDMVGRAYLHELSGPETAVGRLAEGATLAGLALADAEGLGQVLMADGKLALLALGAACTQLAVPADGAVFRRQLRSCIHLGEKVTPKWDQRARFDFHAFGVQADDYQIPKTSAAEALLWLAETLTATMALVEDPEVRDLAERLMPGDGGLGFSHLERTIGLGRLPWAKE